MKEPICPQGKKNNLEPEYFKMYLRDVVELQIQEKLQKKKVGVGGWVRWGKCKWVRELLSTILEARKH